jgi:hypothetical protein
MDRRELLTRGGIFGIGCAAASLASTIDPVSAQDYSHPDVWDLQPDADLPASYQSILTPEERSETLRTCSSGRVDCFPLLEGEIARTTRAFQSWSLFLISNPEWLSPSSGDEIATLYQAYAGFSRAIGTDHAAVFFWKKRPSAVGGKLVGTDIGANIDAARCAEYAKIFDLDISRSPHIVVTRTRPSPTASLKNSVLLELNGLHPSSTRQLLTALAAQLISAKLDQNKLDSQRWWLTWRDAATNVFEILRGSKVAVKIGPLELEIDGQK